MSLKQLRMKRNISQRELATLSGISLRTIQEYEQNRRPLINARAEVLYILSIVLGCSTEELMTTAGGEQHCSPYSLCDTINRDEIQDTTLYSEKYHTYGRFIFRDQSCLIAMVYQGTIYEIGFSAAFSRKNLPWIIDAAIMMMESAIEEITFQFQNGYPEGGMTDEW